jgi:hypothetical protein
MKKRIFLYLAVIVSSIMMMLNVNLTRVESGVNASLSYKVKQSQAVLAPVYDCFTVNANTSGAYDKPDCSVNGCPYTKCTSYTVAGQCK